MMERPTRLPDLDRLSVLIAMIMLAFASAVFVDLPSYAYGIQLPGFYLGVNVSTNTVIALLVAGLTGSGSAWLLNTHPAKSGQSVFQHLILPALTAWVIGVTLSNLPLGPIWWTVFLIGSVLLLLVLMAEYIVVDSHDSRQPLAATVLTALSFALFLVLATSLRSSAVRLFLLLPALAPTAGLVSLRALHLRLQGRWQVPEAVVTGLFVGQIVAALHYWPIQPLNYGLIILGVTYALTILFGNLAESRALPQALIEPALVLTASIGIAVWIS